MLTKLYSLLNSTDDTNEGLCFLIKSPCQWVAEFLQGVLETEHCLQSAWELFPLLESRRNPSIFYTSGKETGEGTDSAVASSPSLSCVGRLLRDLC